MSELPGPPRALILDDEKSIVRLCARVIEGLGARADTAGTLSEAAARIRADRYDLFVCDMRLPDGAGLDLEKLYRERNPGGRIIVMTGSLTPGHPALVAQEIVVLSKPFELAYFRAVVAGALDAGTREDEE